MNRIMSQLLRKANNLTPVIHELIRLANIHNRARNRISNKDEIVHIGDIDLDKYDNDTDYVNSERDMIELLKSYTYDEVVMIEAIMYVGRDEKDPEDYLNRKQVFEEDNEYFDEPEEGVFDSPQKKLYDYMRYVKNYTSNNKQISINNLLSKGLLPEYLERGIIILGLNR